jgi:hypothetical protein
MNWIIITLVRLGLLLMLVAPAVAWTTDMSLSSEGRTEVLTIGSEDGASDEFDVGLDIPLPPPPPSSSFSTHLVGSGIFDILQTDIKEMCSWSIYVISPGEIDITWDAAPISLTMAIGEDRFPLTEAGYHSLNSGEHWISIWDAQSTTSSGPPSSRGDSSSLDSMMPGIPATIAPVASPVSTTAPEQNQANVPLTLATLTLAPSDSASETFQLSPQVGASQTPGFGVILTLISICIMIFTLRNRQIK